MKTSTAVALVVGTVAVAGIAVVGFSAKASPKKKLPTAKKPPRIPKAPQGGAPKVEDPKVEDPKVEGPKVGRPKVRRPIAPDPQEAQWSELEQSVALLSPDAQWRFAVPERRAGAFLPGQTVYVRIDTTDGLVTLETEATSTGFNLVSRLGPTVTYNRDSGVLQIYAGGYAGRVLLQAGDLLLSAWVLSPQARMTKGADGRSMHVIDERVDGVWQAHAFAIDSDGQLIANDSGEFLEETAAQGWADTWLGTHGKAVA